MYVEFEKVEEWICYKWYCTIEFCDVLDSVAVERSEKHTLFNSISQLQWVSCFIASCEWYKLQLMLLVLNVFACITIGTTHQQLLVGRTATPIHNAPRPLNSFANASISRKAQNPQEKDHNSHAAIQAFDLNGCAVMKTGQRNLGVFLLTPDSSDELA